ncbi:MAG: hypothetical protein WBF93_02045, partial [Pirellulales bacterium]
DDFKIADPDQPAADGPPWRLFLRCWYKPDGPSATAIRTAAAWQAIPLPCSLFAGRVISSLAATLALVHVRR